MMHRPSPDRTRALLMLLLANFFWGLSFPLIKGIVLLHGQLLPDAGTWFATINTIAPRFVLAVMFMLIFLPSHCRSVRPREWKQGVIIGLFAAGGMLFQNDGLQFTAASTSAFLTQLYAILIPVWIAVELRKNPGALVWLCCALVLVGVAVLGRIDWARMQLGRGEWETLLSSLFFMGQILTLNRKDFSENRPMHITFVTFVTQGAIFVALALLTAPNARALIEPWTSPAWLSLTLTLTLFCTVASYSIMNKWQPKISATEAGLIYCIEPIFGTALALFLPGLLSIWAAISYPNETATWTLLIGGGLITLANVLLQLNPPPKE